MWLFYGKAGRPRPFGALCGEAGMPRPCVVYLRVF